MSLDLIILAGGMIIAAIVSFMGGRKFEAPKAEKRGEERAVNTIQKQTTEQTLEKVVQANEAARDIDRASPDELRERADRDPNNRGRVQRP